MEKTRFSVVVVLIGLLTILSIYGCQIADQRSAVKRRPNILFVISDDQSYPHASAYGMDVFKTPAFDEVASRGVLFSNAFVAAPQCSPSRAALLTGKHIWQLEEAGTHSSYFPRKFSVFTEALDSAGYHVGYTGKAWGPGNWKNAGWKQNPVGQEYNTERFADVPYSGINKMDYAANFKRFLAERSGDEPFFFWFGAYEPHRPYEYGAGAKTSLNQAGLDVPAFLPRHDSVVNDILDYAAEISWFDAQLGKMLELLKEAGELDNTIVVVTADNGMAFPHAKANLHEYGIHVPLAICGPSVKGGRKVDDLVSFVDLAPTFLELAEAGTLHEGRGKSLVDLLQQDGTGVVDQSREAIFAGRERHTHARPDNTGYPARAIRTADYLYIRNFKPDRWPVGDPPPVDAQGPKEDPELRNILVGYEDIDDSPTKRLLLNGREEWPLLFQAAYAKRPAEQLYDIRRDPECLHDLSSDSAYHHVLEKLRDQLMLRLKTDGDPRVVASGDIFDSYPRFGAMRLFDGFRKRGEYNEKYKNSSE